MANGPFDEKAVFNSARGIAGQEEREAYLHQACDHDPEALRRLVELLRVYDQEKSFLESPPVVVGATVDASIAEHPGTMIGPYKLLQQIGEGGMGVVWMAEQSHPVQRKVAIKVIKPGMDSRQVIARFEAERQALAMMDHVNIARVFDGGTTENGRPYFVMELVHGVPITKYCDDNQLTPRDRLELFVPVCQAIQHAHQKGIIHRDIKPSNVMVTLYDGKPVPKVIDFGVAKATEQKLTERTLFTQYGTMVGTLEYMSPEQAEMSALGVDTRSDIYSLGVLLYELLTGSTPLTQKRMKEAAYSEILRMIKEEEPPKPSTRLSDSGEALASISAQRKTEPAKLTKLVRGELDWIAMKTLEKDRNRRYETANGLAMDVLRYLADEAVQACPPSAGYRLRKFVRRNKVGLAGAGLVLAVVVFLGGGVGWVVRDQAIRQADMERRVDDFLKTATQLRDQKRWSEAREAARQAQLLLATQDGHAELRLRLGAIFTELDMIARLEKVRLDQTEVKDNTWNRAGADAGYLAAFRDYGIEPTAPSADAVAERVRNSSIREELVAALDDWLAILPSTEKARREQVRGVVSRADSDPWRNRFRDPAVQKDRRALVELAALPEVSTLPPPSVVLLGRALRDAGAAQKAVDVLSAGQRRFPADIWLNLELGKTLRWHFQPPRYDEAAGYMRVALVLRPNSAGIYSGLGSCLHTPAHIDEAIAAYRRAIELDPNFADPHNTLASALGIKGLWNEAIDSQLNVVRLRPNSPESHCDLAWAYRCARDTEKAMVAYKEALRVQPKFVDAHHQLAWLLANGPEPRLRNPKRALEIAERHLASRAETVDYFLLVGSAKYRTGDWEGAIASLTRAHKRAKSGNVYVWFMLSMAHAKKGDLEKAQSWYGTAVRGTEERREWASHSLVGEDVVRFRSEAAELLGIENPPGPWPQKQNAGR